MTKARDLANLISTGNPLADGAIAASEVSGLATVATSGAVADVTGAAPLASPTFTGDVTLPDKIVHTGDTNTAIRFADADTVTVETGGSERMRIDDSGRVNVAATTGNEKLNVAGALGVSGASANFSGGNERALVDFTGTLARFGHVNGSSGSAKDVSILSGGGEKFRFGSSGQLGIGGATYGTSGQVLTSGGASAAPTWADAGGGAYELVSKTTISSSTSEVTVNGISAPQNQLLILIDALELDAQGNFMLMYRNSSNTNLDNTGGINANYPQASVGVRADQSTTSVNTTAQSYGIFLNHSQIIANGILSGVVRIFNFGIANVKPYAMGQMVHKVGTNLDEFRYHTFGCEGVFSSGQTVTGLRFYSLNSQNMTSGKIYVYKLL